MKVRWYDMLHPRISTRQWTDVRRLDPRQLGCTQEGLALKSIRMSIDASTSKTRDKPFIMAEEKFRVLTSDAE